METAPDAVIEEPVEPGAPAPRFARSVVTTIAVCAGIYVAVIVGCLVALAVTLNPPGNSGYYYSDDVDETTYAEDSTAPADAIGCPDGSSMVMWAEWPGGATIVCSFGGADYVMIVAHGGYIEQSTAVSTTPTGFRSDVGDIALGGWLFWLPDDGDGYPANSWGSSDWGEFSAGANSIGDIPPCPSGSYAISLSSWSGGWLLTCGIRDGSPTAFRYADGSLSGSGGALTYTGGRYCGTDSDGTQVCVSSAPALVQIGPERYSAESNYFAESGPGGAGQGTGAYGIEAPEETATDQVGYLVAILAKSSAARSTVSGVLAPLNACSVSSGDVQNLRTLTQARTDLLAALRTTPVDQVPGGTNLLGLLTRALELSEQTDQGYVDAAVRMQAGDCAGGNALYGPALALGDQAEAAKQAFAVAWNSSIPATFGVQSYAADDI